MFLVKICRSVIVKICKDNCDIECVSCYKFICTYCSTDENECSEGYSWSRENEQENEEDDFHTSICQIGRTGIGVGGANILNMNVKTIFVVNVKNVVLDAIVGCAQIVRENVQFAAR